MSVPDDSSLEGAYPENLSNSVKGARSSKARDFWRGEALLGSTTFISCGDGALAGIGDFDLRGGGGVDRLGRRISSSSLISPSSRIWTSLATTGALWMDFGEDFSGGGGGESTAITSSWP